MGFELHLGDCLEVLRSLPSDSVDSLVCDPLCGIGFMGLDFDHNRGGRAQWVAWLTQILEECKRVMKPGAIGAVWSLPRTQHWTAWACEDAGFRIWDNLGVAHVFGSGFPKGQAIDRLVDRRLGREGDREVVGVYQSPQDCPKNLHTRNNKKYKDEPQAVRVVDIVGSSATCLESNTITAPATPEAQQWQGWRTPQIKPGYEFWVLIQKRPDGSIVDNIMRHGVGGVNIDGTRVPVEGERPNINSLCSKSGLTGAGGAVTLGSYQSRGSMADGTTTQGRYPANFAMIHHPDCTDEKCHADCPVEEMGRQGGTRTSGEILPGGVRPQRFSMGGHPGGRVGYFPSDTGTAARYFHQFRYEGKASPRDRSELCKSLLWRRDKDSSIGWTQIDQAEYDTLPDRDRAQGNIHATVKNTALMDFLITLTTPPGGTVLDPFMGSGSTGVAAIRKGFGFIGIEQEEGYMAIARTRITNATNTTAAPPAKPPKKRPAKPKLDDRVEALEFQVRGVSAKVRRMERAIAQGQLTLFG